MSFITQPWVLPVGVGVGAFIAGLIVASMRKSGASWFSTVLFFLPNLLLDLLDVIHTKKFKYYGLVLALLAIEAFFAFRASTVYYDVLNSRMPAIEMGIVCVIIFVAVFLCGYMVATHGGTWTWGYGCTMVFVVVHDWAGTLWMNYANTTTAEFYDPFRLILTVGMCLLGLLPFVMGAWAEVLRPELEHEQEEEVNAFTTLATRKIKRRAVEKVLRLANRTDVVHLVQALPRDEFTEFKQFVMPIIALPGTPYDIAPEPETNSVPQSEHNQSPVGDVASGEVTYEKPSTNGHTSTDSYYQRYLELVAVTPPELATRPLLAKALGVSPSSISNYRRKSKANHDELSREVFQPTLS